MLEEMQQLLAPYVLYSALQGLLAIIAKKVSLFYVLKQNLFLQFDSFYFSMYLNLLYESYLPLSTLFLIFFFNHPIQNQISAANATSATPVVRDDGQSRKFFKQFDHFYFFNYHKFILWVLLTTIYIISCSLFHKFDTKFNLLWYPYSRHESYNWSIFGWLLGNWF